MDRGSLSRENGVESEVCGVMGLVRGLFAACCVYCVCSVRLIDWKIAACSRTQRARSLLKLPLCGLKSTIYNRRLPLPVLDGFSPDRRRGIHSDFLTRISILTTLHWFLLVSIDTRKCPLSYCAKSLVASWCDTTQKIHQSKALIRHKSDRYVRAGSMSPLGVERASPYIENRDLVGKSMKLQQNGWLSGWMR